MKRSKSRSLSKKKDKKFSGKEKIILRKSTHPEKKYILQLFVMVQFWNSFQFSHHVILKNQSFCIHNFSLNKPLR